MIKPKALKTGDTVAIVSLSSGMAGDKAFIYRYFEGKKLVIIHNEEHFMDEKADLVIIDEPKNVLPKLGF